MAILRFSHKQKTHPNFTEELHVRVWGSAGKKNEPFYIGSGVNFSAHDSFWLEISYTINNIPAFYTRNFLQTSLVFNRDQVEQYIDRFVKGESDVLAFGDCLPESSIQLKRIKYERTFFTEGEDPVGVYYQLEISSDVGTVLGGEGPGGRDLIFREDFIELEEGLQFMRDLAEEFWQAGLGKHPDPADYPASSSAWSFARETNRRAYDRISQDYQEHYFDSPRLTHMMEAWLEKLPPGGRILDIGCGHGDPVIGRLLERGFCVSGIDASAAMLDKARAKYPTVDFRQHDSTELEDEALYDGICSFSSLLYEDPIDLHRSLLQIWRALKPGGLLFLYAFDPSPSWCGIPFGHRLDEWMWSWSWGMEDAVEALEEHGYFRVLRVRNVTTKEETEALLKRRLKDLQEEHEEAVKRATENGWPLPPPPDPNGGPERLPYHYAILARKKQRRRRPASR